MAEATMVPIQTMATVGMTRQENPGTKMSEHTETTNIQLES